MLLRGAILDVPDPGPPRFIPAAEIEIDDARGTITKITPPFPAPRLRPRALRATP